MSERVIIFDTTLRDGEQSPGASLTVPQKVEIARQLAKLGVDVIEAGFPIASPGDFEAVREVSAAVRGPIICGLARCRVDDIDRAHEALAGAARPRIHVFLATSAIHRQYKLKRAKEEIVKLASEMVAYARGMCEDVEFSPEDASRTEPDFLAEVVEAAIQAGATTVNIPDTVGYAVPDQFGALIAGLFGSVPSIGKAVISVHCHNDLGLGVANSLAAVAAGARQVECTVNGLGERAGNASMEEVVMTLRTRHDALPFETGVDTTQIWRTSRMVAGLTGMRVQRNKAIVGENAFRHEAGIHQDGILKERTTYEIMHPRDIGLTESKLVLGKHSGRHAFREHLIELGHELTDDQLDHAFEAFKRLADKKKDIFDEDIEALIEEEMGEVEEVYHLGYIHTTSGSETVPTATVRLLRGGEEMLDSATGDGPVDAAYKAIERIAGVSAKLLEYDLRGVTAGKDALGEVSVRLESGGATVIGRGSSTDIIEASAKAYLNAVNKLLARENRGPSGK